LTETILTLDRGGGYVRDENRDCLKLSSAVFSGPRMSVLLQERYAASEALHAEKESSGVQQHMSYGDLLALAATMEAALMSTAVALDASPANVLRSMRGSIVDARIAYPQVLHAEIRDAAGELWRFATQGAEFSPSDPDELVGHSIEDAEIDEGTGELRCKLSEGAVLDVKPAAREADDDPPNWELITPDGLVLEFGPGVRWRIGSADARVSSP
jgi:hypothetical protein